MKPKILVAGGSGMVGRYLVSLLLAKGYQVRATYFKNKPQFASLENLELIKVDLTNPRLTETVFKGMDYCFHLASIIKHQRIISDKDIFSKNLKIHLNIFEFASKYNLKRIIYLSSLSLLERLEVPNRNLKEEDFWNAKLPQGSYKAIKLIGEYACFYYFEERGLPYTIIRILASPYGWIEEMRLDDEYVPLHNELVKSVVLNESPLILPESGKIKKGILHFKDYANILAGALNPKACNQQIHVGSKDNLSLDQLAKLALKYTKSDRKLKIVWQKKLKMYSSNFKTDNSRAKQLLGFKQEIEIESGIKELVNQIQESFKQTLFDRYDK